MGLFMFKKIIFSIFLCFALTNKPMDKNIKSLNKLEIEILISKIIEIKNLDNQLNIQDWIKSFNNIDKKIRLILSDVIWQAIEDQPDCQDYQLSNDDILNNFLNFLEDTTKEIIEFKKNLEQEEKRKLIYNKIQARRNPYE